MKQLGYYTFGVCIGLILLFVLSDALFTGQMWQQMTQSKSALTAEYCEFDFKSHFIRQKSNTYSNIFYALTGLLIICQSKKTRCPLVFKYLGFMFIYLCFGSAFFHASLTLLGQRFDMNGTYGLNLTLLVITLIHFNSNWSSYQSAIASALILAQILLFFLYPFLNSGILIPLSILLLTLLQSILYFKQRTHYRGYLILFSLGIVILAIKIRADDVAKIYCDPLSLWQGHAIWHLLTAISAGTSASYFIFQKKDSRIKMNLLEV